MICRTVPVNAQQKRNRTRALGVILSAFLLVQWIAGPAGAAAAVVVALPRTTVIVYPERQMPDAQWAALLQDLQQGFAKLAPETHFTPVPVVVVRGDTLQGGVQVEAPIAIYLHGDCNLAPQPDQPAVHGALGWVLRDQGRIEPYIHVECTRIRGILAPSALWMNRDRCNRAMAEAIARVVLHEWIHFATQSASHQSRGLEKSSFGVADLIPDYYPLLLAAGHGR